MKPHPLDAALAPGRAVMGVLIASLPRRLWNEWEGRVPVRSMTLPAALLALFLGMAVGIPGFLTYAGAMGSTVGGAVIEAGHQSNAGTKPAGAGAYVWYGMIFALPAFLFFTPLGWLSTYLTGSGVVRLLCWAADDPRGDPIVAGLDTLTRRWYAEARARREEAARHAMEGEETPDLRVLGRALGVSDAVYVVVASRLKAGWDPGVFLVTEEGRFRIGTRFDRRFPEGLRAIYPLGEVAAAEVTRRAVAYTLPALSEFDAVRRRTR